MFTVQMLVVVEVSNFRFVKNRWVQLDDETVLDEARFTNWRRHISNPYQGNECTFLQQAGDWNYVAGNNCPDLELCTVCCITDTPVLMIKGGVKTLFSLPCFVVRCNSS